MNDINKMKAMSKDFENLLNEDYKETMKPKIRTTNPLSGQSIYLTEEEHAKWKAVMKANETADPNNGDDPTWDIVRKGITWFQKHNIKAYMTLLD